MDEKTAEQYQKEIKIMVETVNDLAFLKRLSLALTVKTKDIKRKTQGI